MPTFGRALIALLSVLPKHAMSRAAGALATRPVPPRYRERVYRGYSRVFGARPEEAELPLDAYPTLNAFFTRALKPGLRPVAADAIVAPADSAVGAWGPVANDTLIQAKGKDYSLRALLGDDALAHRMNGGTFATFYLAPKDYHRFHVPVDGVITEATYIPGELWPVNTHAVTHVADLFAVNERIVVRIERPGAGVVAVALVGATMVGMTRLVFDDLHTNARRREVQRRTYDPGFAVRAGDPLGHFEFGSTVIVVCSPESGALEPLEVDQVVRMGERLGPLTQAGEGAAARG
ncbi:archaetidylserine decarboxylase [Roseisolibacter sp. H3M3-2]|uniref:archaetidylserine decarboxylase n=1 Tax=Roseisolibacter sp. H3M3-2 TaxID=3031323 RepID=UPI0023DB9122|nr:archaetidylserine decarboxylase [Roseisolibacter sp. H3M3-2]MDF1503191.1 archaetidylserine decarboxylase [Roseisolibacter sp. H3M3-2]